MLLIISRVLNGSRWAVYPTVRCWLDCSHITQDWNIFKALTVVLPVLGLVWAEISASMWFWVPFLSAASEQDEMLTFSFLWGGVGLWIQLLTKEKLVHWTLTYTASSNIVFEEEHPLSSPPHSQIRVYVKWERLNMSSSRDLCSLRKVKTLCLPHVFCTNQITHSNVEN